MKERLYDAIVLETGSEFLIAMKNRVDCRSSRGNHSHPPHTVRGRAVSIPQHSTSLDL